MERIKKFESYIAGVSDKEFFTELYEENPLKDTHFFYGFIYKDGYKESPEGSGNYKKTSDIEQMYKIDSSNFNDLKGMKMRASFTDQQFAVIWFPKEMDINGKSSDDMDLWLIDLIIKHRSTQHGNGKKVFDKLKKTNTIKGERRIKTKKVANVFNI